MAEKNLKAASSFSYRNIKKDFEEFKEVPVITPNCHLELGENYETQIVEDRPDDWFELHQQGLDSVGVRNILELLAKRQENGFDGRFAYKDNEAMDTSMIDPMDPEGVKKLVASQSESEAKLQKMASELGVSVDVLVDSVLKGTLAQVIVESQKSAAVEETKEEGK